MTDAEHNRIFGLLDRLDDKVTTIGNHVSDLNTKVAVLTVSQTSMSVDITRALKCRSIPWKTLAGAVVALAAALTGAVSYVQ